MQRLAVWQWTVAGLALVGLVVQLLVGWAQAASAVAAAAGMAVRVLVPVLELIWLPLLAVVVIWRGHHAWQVLRQATKKLWHRGRRRGLVAPIGLEILVLIGLLTGAVFVLPNLLVSPDVTTSAERLVELRNNVRGTLIQAVGGLLLVLAAVAAWRQLHIAREGHITERYTRAVDQLGATGDHGHEKVDVQLGGIYALERLAHDSRHDQPTIVEVLTAFVRGRATRTDEPEEHESTADRRPLQARLPTVDAAMSVLARMPRPSDVRLQLANVDLRGISLDKANLARANLSNANLSGVDLTGADLTGARLAGADLTGAILISATLTDAFLEYAILIEAILADADLTHANLIKAELTRADLCRATLIHASLAGAALTHTNLPEANLTGTALVDADLTGANLRDTNLTDVRANVRTIWADGFDPAAAGVTVEGTSH